MNSDAPDDYVALRELRDKPDYRSKFKLTDEMVRACRTVVCPALMADSLACSIGSSCLTFSVCSHLPPACHG